MRLLYWIFLSLISLLLLWINQGFYRSDMYVKEAGDMMRQLNFLEEELKEKSLGKRMQAIYPEGNVFINALYGLSQTELALYFQSEGVQYLPVEALEEAIYAFEQVDMDEARYPFSKSMTPAYGIYYQGWRNYLLAKILSTELDFENRAGYEKRFAASCHQIARAFRESESPFLPSYPGQAWPADSFLAMASLSLHDKHFEPLYSSEIQTWLEKVKDLRDVDNGMIAHKTMAETGQTIEPPRGGSMTLMLRLLAEIDLEFALEQYQLFKTHFKSTALTLPMVREYPKGSFGLGDIDSGPVILGTGFAATIVSIGTYQVFGDQALAEEQFRVVHAFGLSRVQGKQRSYLLGSLPMADAFIVWSRLAPRAVEERAYEGPGGIFWKFHGLSLLIILLIALPLYRRQLIEHIKAAMNKKS